MFGQCQHANTDMLPTTPTITQRWSIDCFLAKKKMVLAQSWPDIVSTNEIQNCYSKITYVGQIRCAPNANYQPTVQRFANVMTIVLWRSFNLY